MKTLRSVVTLLIALCILLAASCALADQVLEGDANVDQRNYPSTAPLPPSAPACWTALPAKPWRKSGRWI